VGFRADHPRVLQLLRHNFTIFDSVMKKQYITDDDGNKVAVILPIKKYEQMLQDLQMKEDVALYDKVKAEDDGERIDLEDYVKSRKGKKSA
jgi:hypothetical protein